MPWPRGAVWKHSSASLEATQNYETDRLFRVQRRFLGIPKASERTTPLGTLHTFEQKYIAQRIVRYVNLWNVRIRVNHLGFASLGAFDFVIVVNVTMNRDKDTKEHQQVENTSQWRHREHGISRMTMVTKQCSHFKLTIKPLPRNTEKLH